MHDSDGILEILFLILGAVALIIFIPLLNFVSGWVVGWLIKITFAPTFLSGLSLIGINIDSNSIPLFCGTLGVLGSFFKNTVQTKKD
jgi:hypothetical protein